MSGTSGHVIWVEFDLKPDQRGAFLALVRGNAARSVADEAGCRRFDVLLPANAADTVALYEIYDDEAAFRAHLATDHFRDFDKASAPMVLNKRVRAFNLEENAK